jgi:hypothetical protein
MVSRARAPHKARYETKHYSQSTQEETMRPLEEIGSGPSEAMIRARAHEIFLQRGGDRRLRRG